MEGGQWWIGAEGSGTMVVERRGKGRGTMVVKRRGEEKEKGQW